MTEFKKLPQDIQDKLYAPLPAEAIKPHPSKSFLSTIKAIYVTERFNEVFGVNGWPIKTDILHWEEKTRTKKDGSTYNEFVVMAKTTISFPEYSFSHECIAGSSNEDLGDAAKGATTDAITKIGSYIGVGIDVFKGKPTAKPEGKKETPKVEAPKRDLPWLNETDAQFEYTKKRVSEGVPIETIRQSFRISKAVEAKLLAK